MLRLKKSSYPYVVFALLALQRLIFPPRLPLPQVPLVTHFSAVRSAGAAESKNLAS